MRRKRSLIKSNSVQSVKHFFEKSLRKFQKLKERNFRRAVKLVAKVKKDNGLSEQDWQDISIKKSKDRKPNKEQNTIK